jgi:hypothetical protein
MVRVSTFHLCSTRRSKHDQRTKCELRFKIDNHVPENECHTSFRFSVLYFTFQILFIFKKQDVVLVVHGFNILFPVTHNR